MSEPILYPVAIVVNTNAERRHLLRDGGIKGRKVLVVGEMTLGYRFSAIDDRVWTDDMSIKQFERYNEWLSHLDCRVIRKDSDE